MFLDAFGKIMKCKGMIICSRNNNAESEIGSKASSVNIFFGTQFGEDVVV